MTNSEVDITKQDELDIVIKSPEVHELPKSNLEYLVDTMLELNDRVQGLESIVLTIHNTGK